MSLCGLLSIDTNLLISNVNVSSPCLSAHSLAELCAAQLNDPVITLILHGKEAGKHSAVSPADIVAYCRLIQLWDQLIIKEGVLYRLFAGPTDSPFIFN